MTNTTRALAPLATTALLVAGTAPVAAQPTDYEAIVRIMRECAKIEDINARVACYDNTIGTEKLITAQQASQDAPRPQPAPPQVQAATSPAAAPQAGQPSGFGSESLPQPVIRQTEKRDESQDRIKARLAAAEERTPGVYLLTLEDGAQWEFVEAVPFSYNPPGRGSSVEISRAALGSFQLRYAGQGPVRVQRVR